MRYTGGRSLESWLSGIDPHRRRRRGCRAWLRHAGCRGCRGPLGRSRCGRTELLRGERNRARVAVGTGRGRGEDGAVDRGQMSRHRGGGEARGHGAGKDEAGHGTGHERAARTPRCCSADAHLDTPASSDIGVSSVSARDQPRRSWRACQAPLAHHQRTRRRETTLSGFRSRRVFFFSVERRRRLRNCQGRRSWRNSTAGRSDGHQIEVLPDGLACMRHHLGGRRSVVLGEQDHNDVLAGR